MPIPHKVENSYMLVEVYKRIRLCSYNLVITPDEQSGDTGSNPVQWSSLHDVKNCDQVLNIFLGEVLLGSIPGLEPGGGGSNPPVQSYYPHRLVG